MAKTSPTRKVTTPKTRTRKVVRRVVKEPEVKHEGTTWLGTSPWLIIVGIIALLLILFVPMFSATKTVQKTETIMVSVQKERQEQVTVDEAIKVYTGWLQEGGETIARTGYYIEYDSWGNPYYVPYTYYDKAVGRTVTVDAVDEIVEYQQSPGPNNTYVITLTAYDGTQVVHRDKTSFDLTKTGKANVQVSKTVSTPYTDQVPQQVTRDEQIKLRVNLISLIFGNY